jgi:transcriptional regulator with GAF, ATPase, and Fis domain
LPDRSDKRLRTRTLLLTTIGTGVFIEIAVALMPDAQRHSLLVRSLTVWPLAVLVVYVAARGFDRLSRRVDEQTAAAAAALDQVKQLRTTNSLLHQLASSANVSTVFDVLSSRIGDVVPCDRLAIALADTGQQFQVFIGRDARTRNDEPSKQVHHFQKAGTLIAEVADAGQPRLVGRLAPLAPTHLDANVLSSSGLASAAVIPLRAEATTLGALMVLSRSEDAFTPAHVETLLPIADIVAVAFATQSLARALGRSQLAKDMADVMFSLANDINGALQAIVGHCELLSREYRDPGLQRDLAMLMRQAERATEVLAQVQGLAESRLQRVNSVANLLEDPNVEEWSSLPGRVPPGAIRR